MTTKENDARGRGRPEKSASDRKSEITQFRVTPAERTKLENAADQRGMKLSDWLREVALASV